MNGNSTKAAAKPSDLELMLYADGELDADRLEEVEAWLARDAAPRGKLAGLALASTLIREGASSSSAADGIADAVMGLVASPLTMGPQAAPNPGPYKPALITTVPRTTPAKAANDNARGIFALAAVAMAAAAALVLWGRAGVDPAQLPDRAVAVQAAPAPIKVEAPAAAKIEAAEGEAEHGVEVAAVDFGARMGSIFYVSSGTAASNATTTVVWLNDDAAGEK